MKNNWYIRFKTGTENGPFSEEDTKKTLNEMVSLEGCVVRQGDSQWFDATIVLQRFRDLEENGIYLSHNNKCIGPFTLIRANELAKKTASIDKYRVGNRGSWISLDSSRQVVVPDPAAERVVSHPSINSVKLPDQVWFYAVNGQSLGPVTSQTLQELLGKGVLDPETHIWREGLANWVRADSLAGLFPKQKQAGSPPIPPANLTRPHQAPADHDRQTDLPWDRAAPDPTEVFDSVKRLEQTKLRTLTHAAKQKLEHVSQRAAVDNTHKAAPQSTGGEPETTPPKLRSSQKKLGLIGCGGFLAILLICSGIGSLLPEPREQKFTPFQSSWDGSVQEVKDYIYKNAKDPDSVRFIKWYELKKSDSGGYLVRVEYRAKNSFGGYVRDDRVFTITENGVVYPGGM